MADKPKMYRVYSVVPRPKQDDYWLNIGAAFLHEAASPRWPVQAGNPRLRFGQGESRPGEERPTSHEESITSKEDAQEPLHCGRLSF
jgi:hypothetical protein